MTSRLNALLVATAERAAAYRSDVVDRPVQPRDADVEAARARLGELSDGSTEPETVIDELCLAVEPLLVGSAGPRYFGFVTGASLDSPTAADFLTTAWDQLAFNAVSSPAAALVEEVTGEWLKDLLGLPAHASFGFTSGAQGANTVSLAAARHHVLSAAGWDVERDGLFSAPPIRVVATSERHATIDRALRFLGIGADALEPVRSDAQGSIDTAALAEVLGSGRPGPTIVCLQAGNVNSGAFDDFDTACAIARDHGAWVHVDGAFGLWAAASSATRHLVKGVDLADSWATDGHKWLNVPYDSGYAFTAHPEVHAAVMAFTAAYLVGQGQPGLRSPSDYVPESSRRARGFATWAALRELGRDGVADLVERCCAHARRFAALLSTIDGVEVANDVVLNQVLVDFGDPERTDAVIDAVQRSGVCWMGPTTWHDRRLMRISVSSWRTTTGDVDASVAAISAAVAEMAGQQGRAGGTGR